MFSTYGNNEKSAFVASYVLIKNKKEKKRIENSITATNARASNQPMHSKKKLSRLYKLLEDPNS